MHVVACHLVLLHIKPACLNTELARHAYARGMESPFSEATLAEELR